MRDEEGLSVKSRVNYYALLKTVFDLAVEMDLVVKTPLRKKIHRPKLDSRRVQKVSLAVDEINSLILSIPDENRTLFYCLATTGLRIGELLALRWQDIDFDESKLVITHNLWRGQLVTPKTEAGKRSLFLPDPLVEALRWHKEASEFGEGSDHVFCRPDGKPLDPDELRENVLCPAMDRAGINRGDRTHGFHIFRHTAATIIADRTGKMKLAQEQLGHAQMSTTANIYVHPNSEELEEAAKALTDVVTCPP